MSGLPQAARLVHQLDGSLGGRDQLLMPTSSTSKISITGFIALVFEDGWVICESRRNDREHGGGLRYLSFIWSRSGCSFVF